MHALFQPPYPAEDTGFRQTMRSARIAQQECPELRWHPMARLITFAVSGTLAWAAVIFLFSLVLA